jgi:hypothetical protein
MGSHVPPEHVITVGVTTLAETNLTGCIPRSAAVPKLSPDCGRCANGLGPLMRAVLYTAIADAANVSAKRSTRVAGRSGEPGVHAVGERQGSRTRKTVMWE